MAVYGGPTVSAVGAIGAAATGAAAAGLAISDRAGQKAEQRLQAVSYRVEVEAGGKATTLAGGLYEIVAFGIMSDVGNIMGLPATYCGPMTLGPRSRRSLSVFNSA